MVERRYYNYPGVDALFPIVRKFVSLKLDFAEVKKVRANIGDYRVYVVPERLEILWDRGRDGVWSVDLVRVHGTPGRGHGFVFQHFDVNGPRVPKWIPMLIQQHRPCDEEVMAEWATLEL